MASESSVTTPTACKGRKKCSNDEFFCCCSIDLYEEMLCQGDVSFHAASCVFKVQFFDYVIDVGFLRPTLNPLFNSSFVSLLARVTSYFPSSSNINMSSKHAAAFLLRVKLFVAMGCENSTSGPVT